MMIKTVCLAILFLLLGCGSAPTSQIELTTQIVVDAGVEETNAPVEPTVVVPPEPKEDPHFVMKGTSLDGPFRSTGQACKWLKKEFIGTCVKGKNDWDKGKVLGERGGILSARTIAVKLYKEKAKSTEDACAVLVKTSKGWWLRDHRKACQNNDDMGGEGFFTSLRHIDYADGLSFGVLTLERHGDRAAQKIETVNGVEEESTWWVDQTERMFCAVNSDGEPKCSQWHVTNCHFNDRYVSYHKGEILIEDGRSDAGLCFDRMIKPGAYALFEPGFHKPAGAIKARDMGGEEDPLEPVPMFGPFSSVKAYCNSLPHDYDIEDDYSYESSGSPEPPPKCLMSKKGWSKVQPIGNNGAIKAARLLRVKSNLAGAPIEYCHVAFKTEKGWFFSDDSYHCQGVLGPSTDADIVTRQTQWVGTKDKPALAIVYDLTLMHKDYGQHEYDPEFEVPGPIEKPLKKRPSKKAPYESPGRVAHVMFCGLGPSGVPSCSGNIQLGCPYDHGNKVYKAWTYNGVALELKGPEELMEGCDSYSDFKLGEHELTFP